MTTIHARSTDSSPEIFLVIVVGFIIIAGFALYLFRIFPFDTWLTDDRDSVTIQMKGPVANPAPSLRL